MHHEPKRMNLPAFWPFSRRRYEGFHYVELEFESADRNMELLAAAKSHSSFDECTHLAGTKTIAFRFRDGEEAMLFKLSA